MKKAFIAILGFYLLVHILGPFFYQLKFGFIHYFREPFDYESIKLVVILNTISILIAIVLIILLPEKKNTMTIEVKGTTFLYVISIVLSLISFQRFNGFAGILAGKANGSIFAYLSMFFDSSVLLFVLLTSTKNKLALFGSVIIYVVAKSIGGSRSAIFSVLLIIMMLFATKELKKLIRPFLAFFLVGLILTPSLFFFATYQRNGYLEKNKLGYFMEIVVQRISHLESGALPVYNKESDGKGIKIFYDKYSLRNQLKLAVNAMVPGNVFAPDVDPNQYYRSAFLGYSLELSNNYYTSINITLPVYFYMYGGFLFAISVSIILILAFYLLAHLFSGKFEILNFAFLFSLYELLSYFDFVMIARRFIYISCTLVMVMVFSRIYPKIITKIKKQK